MRLIDGLTYAENDPRLRDLTDWVHDNYTYFATTADLMMRAVGINSLHIAVVYYAPKNEGDTGFRPAAFLTEFIRHADFSLLDYVRFDPLYKVYHHYRDYSVQEDQIITEINPEVVDRVKNILYTCGKKFGLVVVSSFPFLRRTNDYYDNRRLAKLVLSDLKQVFRSSGEPDLQNAAVLAEFV